LLDVVLPSLPSLYVPLSLPDKWHDIRRRYRDTYTDGYEKTVKGTKEKTVSRKSAEEERRKKKRKRDGDR
jgi:hypothetical protein